MKKTQYGLILALILASAFFLWRECRPKEIIPVINKHMDTVATKRLEIDSLLRRQHDLRQQLKEDSIEQATVRMALNAKIDRLEKKLAQRRPEVQPILDSIPILKEFVAIQDSVIMGQSALIDTLENQAWDIANRYEGLLQNAEERYQLSQEVNRHMDEIVKEYQKDARKQKKRGALKAVAVGVLGFAIGRL